MGIFSNTMYDELSASFIKEKKFIATKTLRAFVQQLMEILYSPGC